MQMDSSLLVMKNSQLKTKLDLICAPSWKIWISSSKKRIVKKQISEQGADIIPELIKLSSGTNSPKLVEEVNSIIKAIGNPAIFYLVETGINAREFTLIITTIYTMLQFSELPGEVIPYLILWMSEFSFSKQNLPTTGNDEMDKMILPELNKLPQESVRWFIANYSEKKEIIMIMAGDALSLVGAKAKYLLPFLKLLFEKNRHHVAGRITLEKTISKLEYC